MTGRLVAEFRYGARAHVNAFKRGGYWWFAVRLGKKDILTCDCKGGNSVTYLPDVDYRSSWGCCSHIVALYDGKVTDDKRDFRGDFRVSRAHWQVPQAPMFAKLTLLGQKMFYPRWVAKAL
jgi:hypothetical protein